MTGLLVLVVSLALMGADIAVCIRRPRLWFWWGGLFYCALMGGVAFGVLTLLGA